MFETLIMVNLFEKRQAIQSLIDTVTHRIHTAEYQTSTIKGVRYLSRTDLEESLLYAETLIQNGGAGFAPMRNPDGNVLALFQAFRVL